MGWLLQYHMQKSHIIPIRTRPKLRGACWTRHYPWGHSESFPPVFFPRLARFESMLAVPSLRGICKFSETWTLHRIASPRIERLGGV